MDSLRNILVPTDFSACSKQAIRFALQIARLSGARLILYHAVHPPVSTSVSIMINKLIRQMRLDAERDLKQLLLNMPELQQVAPQIILEAGFMEDRLPELIAQHEVDLVVMGTRGASKGIASVLGSNTTRVIEQVTCPVLAVPEKASLAPIRRILFATDYEPVPSEKVIAPLVKLAQIFDAEITVLKVDEEERGALTMTETLGKVRLQLYFDRVRSSYHLTTHEDVAEGIEDYIRMYPIEMLAMMPRRHTVFERLFKESHTRRMALHTNYPLLTFRAS
ncbi:Nucleotide-binding universal stress protein, UspA family [Catalinimonas alkaloidigena]|uniref:Nucleotide-binding universal stress protein, UspA family n=1 Tax=Catalinimonas alkaloidigena TaxID=1075417 RepID=A0A1G8WCU1_9BACT|nr:universal stress protein [Catalinimonas alkaloidigena]SDJ75400.1 Nucleotide-binding universal stress protein, UspA family [Catalinimonas alkaloidigena]